MYPLWSKYLLNRASNLLLGMTDGQNDTISINSDNYNSTNRKHFSIFIFVTIIAHKWTSIDQMFYDFI